MKNPPAARRSPRSLVRASIRDLQAYVPGEQPKIQRLVKLNTNENPFPPSPKVLAAIRAGTDGRLRLYPNPTAQPLREKLARFHHCHLENIIVGNGSDELLAMATRAFAEPVLATSSGTTHRSTVQYFSPSYSLYPVLAEIHGTKSKAIPLKSDFGLPTVKELKRSGSWDFEAALTFVTTPNAPSGRGYSTDELEELCRAHRGVLVLDEAYVDFANENALGLALKYPHVLVARTFSKAYSLCFLRVGYFVGHPELIAGLQKIRDSYNVNGLGQLAAQTTMDNLPYYRANFRRIVRTRESLSRELSQLGFEVFPSQTNFILARPPAFPAEEWQAQFRKNKVLVRWFNSPELRDYLRITIGTNAQANYLLQAARKILGHTTHRTPRTTHSCIS
jgi:histidinol-phosphate aminotransferase